MAGTDFNLGVTDQRNGEQESKSLRASKRKGRAMIDTNKLLKEIEKEITFEAKYVFLKIGQEAARDGREFLSAVEGDIKKWSLKLDSGSLSREGYIALVNGTKDLAGMPALKQKGIGWVMIKEFKDRMAEVIIDRTMGMLA